MASSVKVNIPGVGTVEAENAASEATLLAILAAVQKSEATKKKEEKTRSAELKKQEAETQKAAKEWEKSLEGMTDSEKKAAVEKKKREKERDEMWGKTKVGMGAAGKELFGAFSSIAKSAVSVTTAFLTSYDDIANNPIAAGAAVLNAGIDASNTAVHGVANAATGLAGAFGPVAGAFVGGLASLVTGISDAAAAILKATNDVMAKEFQKSTQALKDYTKQGASFAGGMQEMRTLANDAGLSLTTLSKASTSSSESLRQAGFSQGEGTAMLAKGFTAATRTIGKSGASLSNEMLAMGYSYEEQMGIQADYMAQLKRSGVDLKNLAPAELAQGTRDYAKNLKVISDITGADAKKLLEKAAAETQRASLMSDLDAKQKESYKQSFAALEKMGPDADKARQALYQIMKTGTTNVVGYTSGPARKMIEDMAKGVKSGTMDFKGAVGTMSDASKEAAAANKGSVGAATDFAKGMGATGEAIDAFSQTQNSMLSLSTQNLGEMVTQSDKNAESQANMAGKSGSVEQSFANITSVSQKAAAAMEAFTGSHLDTYAKLLADTFKEASDTVQKGVKMANMTTTEKVTGAAVGAVEYGAAGAGAGALLGGPVGAAIGGIGGALYGGFKGWTGLADGGWASGDPTGFLEKLHGTELVIPTTGGMLDTNSTGYSELVKAVGGGTALSSDKGSDSLIQKMDELITALGQHSGGATATTAAASSSGDMIANAFNGMQDMLAKQLDIHTEMNSHARDNKDLMQKLLNVSM
jgi:hypothetical protein